MTEAKKRPLKRAYKIRYMQVNTTNFELNEGAMIEFLSVEQLWKHYFHSLSSNCFFQLRSRFPTHLSLAHIDLMPFCSEFDHKNMKSFSLDYFCIPLFCR